MKRLLTQLRLCRAGFQVGMSPNLVRVDSVMGESEIYLFDIHPGLQELHDQPHSHLVDSFANMTESLASGRAVQSQIFVEETASFLEDIHSLDSHFSFRSSWTSSNSSLTTVEPYREHYREHDDLQPPGPRGILQALEHTKTRRDVLSGRVLIDTCCHIHTTCLHAEAESLVQSCPTNTGTTRRTYLSVNEKDALGNTLLHLAANWSATLPVFFSLIDSGADVEVEVIARLDVVANSAWAGDFMSEWSQRFWHLSPHLDREGRQTE